VHLSVVGGPITVPMMEWTWGRTAQIASIHLQGRTKLYQEKRAAYESVELYDPQFVQRMVRLCT
jgi:hypothetical protein